MEAVHSDASTTTPSYADVMDVGMKHAVQNILTMCIEGIQDSKQSTVVVMNVGGCGEISEWLQF